jgi:hypothetical protein
MSCRFHADADLLIVCVHLAERRSDDWIQAGPDWLCPECAANVENLPDDNLLTTCTECASHERAAATLRKIEKAN